MVYLRKGILILRIKRRHADKTPGIPFAHGIQFVRRDIPADLVVRLAHPADNHRDIYAGFIHFPYKGIHVTVHGRILYAPFPLALIAQFRVGPYMECS